MKIMRLSYSGDWYHNAYLSTYRGFSEPNLFTVSVHPEFLEELEAKGLKQDFVEKMKKLLPEASNQVCFDTVESLKDLETTELYRYTDKLSEEETAEVLKEPDYPSRLQKAKELSNAWETVA